jgi:hypothetical protein
MRGRRVGTGTALAAVLVVTLFALSGTAAVAPRDADAAATVTFSPRLVVRVPGSSTLYLVTEGTCSKRFCLQMWRSGDTGKSFVRRAAPPVVAETGSVAGSLDRLVFANAIDGFAIVGKDAGTLYATTNGARSWHRITTIPAKRWSDLVVTAHSILVTTERCTRRTGFCTDFRVWRSGLTARDWSVLPTLWRTGRGPKDVYYGPSVAAFGENVWEQETAYMATYLWISHDDGRTFARLSAPQLGSVAGCDFFPMSTVELWAECPTGMQVSFWHSSDGGVRWTRVSQSQFFGTGGGDFDPVSNSSAYLDYGAAIRVPNLVRLTDDGRTSTRVGELPCAQVSLTFTSNMDGLAICGQNDSSYTLLRTTDGGAKWGHEVLWGP